MEDMDYYQIKSGYLKGAVVQLPAAQVAVLPDNRLCIRSDGTIIKAITKLFYYIKRSI